MIANAVETIWRAFARGAGVITPALVKSKREVYSVSLVGKMGDRVACVDCGGCGLF